MKKVFAEILEAIELDDPFLEDLRQRIRYQCDSQVKAAVLISELNHDERNDDCQGNGALYSLLKSLTYNELKNKNGAFADAADAVTGFRVCGNDFNEALARWYFGLLYVIYKESHMAIPELHEAVRLLTRSAKLNEPENNYNKITLYEGFIKHINRTIELLKINITSIPNPQSVPGGIPPSWRIARIEFGPYDKGFASKDIILYGNPYQLFNCHGGNEIKVLANGEYDWLEVPDNGMDSANPIPITKADYVLLEQKTLPQPNDIIVASMQGAKPPARFIKRFSPSNLLSESSTAIPPIPINVVDIHGVVIAIAKPA
jgi:hypothetical protein